MTVTEFTINFDQPSYYPGQMITGHVCVTLDKPKDVRGVELKLKGRTKFQWSESESYTDAEGKSQTRTVTRKGKESYLTTTITLLGSKTELIIGAHNYPFAVVLPANVPATFKGKYGGVSYYGKAKIDIPLAVDKVVKTHFQVENPLDLNQFPHLKTSAKKEKSKTFCCLCCASGPLTMVVHVPKTGFGKGESIPLTVEIDNASNVAINDVKAELCKKIHWKAQGDSKEEKYDIKKQAFGAVSENSSKTWSENIPLDCGPFPNMAQCNIITISYKLEVKANPSGAHSNLEIEIPVTIGDIPFHDGESIPPANPGTLPVAPGFPQAVNPPMPGGFIPPAAGGLYPIPTDTQNLNPNFGFNVPAPTPYLPTPGSNGPAPYPSGPGYVNPVPYPPGSGGGDPGSYPTQPSYAPSSGPYPSSYAPPNAEGQSTYPAGPATFNVPAGTPVPPNVSDFIGGNSVTYPRESNPANSSYSYAPPFFNNSSVEMPKSTFLGGDSSVSGVRDHPEGAPLLPSAPSAPIT